MSDTLKMYTVYDHPTDFPDHYVVRGFNILPGKVIPDPQLYMKHEDLLHIRQHLASKGLACIGRMPQDDNKIIETWL